MEEQTTQNWSFELASAIMTDNPDLLMRVRIRGESVIAKNYRGETPMECAASLGHYAIMYSLNYSGVSLTKKNEKGLSPLTICANSFEAKIKQLENGYHACAYYNIKSFIKSQVDLGIRKHAYCLAKLVALIKDEQEATEFRHSVEELNTRWQTLSEKVYQEHRNRHCQKITPWRSEPRNPDTQHHR